LAAVVAALWWSRWLQGLGGWLKASRAELVRYAIELRSLTGGRARFKAERVAYEILSGALPEAATA